jgi:acetolactate synthase-1/2/3 large subunit
MSKTDGGRLVVKALLREGVKYIFSLSGGHIAPIYNASLDEGVRIIDTRHEQAAAHMAEGWSLVTGEMGVCAVTAGPGLTDAVTAVANAQQSNTPLLVLGGRSALAENDRGSLQDIDQMALMKPITKWARICHQTRRIPEYVATAYRHALGGRPGPVYLEIPMDILYAKVEDSEVSFPNQYRTSSRPGGSPEALAAAADILTRAERPLILAGSGCLWSRAGDSLKTFAERTGMPVITRTGGRGVLPDSHPLAISGSMLHTLSPLSMADTIVVLGSRLNFTLGYGRFFQAPMNLIQVDIEPTELGFNRGPDVGIWGDIRLVLDDLVRRVPEKPDRAWPREAKQMVRDAIQAERSTYDLNAVPIHPRRLVEEVRDVVGGEASFVCDGGDSMLWGSEAFPAERPAAVISTGPLGCLGVGLPFALAAKLAQPDRTVVLLSGDGSFGLNGMEIDTAVRHNLPVICVICNDQAWGMVKHGQEMLFGHDRTCGTELGVVRYDLMAQGLGGYGEFIERPEEIKPALERSLRYGKVSCINVMVDPTLPHPVTRYATQAGLL